MKQYINRALKGYSTT